MSSRSNPKTIIFDVDGVLADFVLGFTQAAGAAKPWGSAVNDGLWDFSDRFTKAVINATWEVIKNDPWWWRGLPPLVSSEVFDQIEELSRTHQVLFVTARVSYHNAQYQTHRWLQDHGIISPDVVVTHRKGDIAKAVGASFHIDDKPENVAYVHWTADNQPCRSYFLERPPTAEKSLWLPANVKRVTDVSEFIQDIKESK